MTEHYTDTGHDYVSTACWHAQHGQCRLTCKWCDATCRCACHLEHAPGSMGEAIAESSFGTDEAMALRARTPRAVADEMMARLAAGYSGDRDHDVEVLKARLETDT